MPPINDRVIVGGLHDITGNRRLEKRLGSVHTLLEQVAGALALCRQRLFARTFSALLAFGFLSFHLLLLVEFFHRFCIRSDFGVERDPVNQHIRLPQILVCWLEVIYRESNLDSLQRRELSPSKGELNLLSFWP